MQKKIIMPLSDIRWKNKRSSITKSMKRYGWWGTEFFGGTVGFRIAEFDLVAEAQDFLLQGVSLERINPDIWSEILAM